MEVRLFASGKVEMGCNRTSMEFQNHEAGKRDRPVHGKREITLLDESHCSLDHINAERVEASQGLRVWSRIRRMREEVKCEDVYPGAAQLQGI